MADKLLNLLQTTPPPWELSETPRAVPPVSWIPEEVQILVRRLDEWWEAEGRELAESARGDVFGFFAAFPAARFGHILSVLTNVVLPRLPLGDPRMETAASLLRRMQEAGILIDLALPVILAATQSSREETAASLRLSLVSMARERTAAAVEGVYVWLEAAQRGCFLSRRSTLLRNLARLSGRDAPLRWPTRCGTRQISSSNRPWPPPI
jgi:hypothetical protein